MLSDNRGVLCGKVEKIVTKLHKKSLDAPSVDETESDDNNNTSNLNEYTSLEASAPELDSDENEEEKPQGPTGS